MATRREVRESAPAQPPGEPGPSEVRETEPLPALLRDIITESTTLVRQEIELARTEFREKLALVRRYALGMAVGGALLGCAFFFLLSAIDRGFSTALRIYLADDVAVWLAPLILAALLGAIGAWVLASARRTLRTEGLTPEQTVRTLRENTTWIKEKLR